MQDLQNISKTLSFHLRHRPEELEIDDQGWVDINQVLKKLNIDLDTLKILVNSDNKQRYSFNVDMTKIRANQGHSIPHVNINFQEVLPPEFLFHGTSPAFIKSIMKTGLQKRTRKYVHLSSDKETAYKVGKRHSKQQEPVILIIKSKELKETGHKFFMSDNNVWLTDDIDPKYITI